MSDLALHEEFPSDQSGHRADEIPFVERSGLEYLHIDRGRAVLRLPFEPNVNHVGMVYAGALFTLAEIPGGVLFGACVDMEKYYPVVGNLDLRFTRPAMSACMVDARMTEAEMTRIATELADSGKTKWILESDLVDLAGNVVAKSSGTYFGRAY